MTLLHPVVPLLAALHLTAPAVAQHPLPDAQPAAVEVGRSLDSVLAQNARLSSALDSLRGELERHRVQEDFYDTALDEQANRFSLIITGLLGMAALLTWGGFKLEVNSTRREMAATLREQKERFQELEKRFEETELYIVRTRRTLFQSMHGGAKREGDEVYAFFYLLVGAAASHELYRRLPSDPRRATRLSVVVGNLRAALEHLERVQPGARLLAMVDTNQTALRAAFSELRGADDEEVLRLTLAIRADLDRLQREAGPLEEPAA